MLSDLTQRQRKVAYLCGAIALLIPVVLLGMPADAKGEGGVIAELRAEEGLGETSLGEVDPASSSMNLMLLGLRGIAANQLWLLADEQKTNKQFADLEQTVGAIIKLQPHYVNVWKFQGWNLAYNVSAEFDSIPDRYYWVKRGAKFMKDGIARNTSVPVLQHDRGDFLGKKIGESDEWRMFRRYFMADPDAERYNGGPDPEVNPDIEDNYIVAKRQYADANETESRPDAIYSPKMARTLFRSYPARSQLDYADALQREGRFDNIDLMKSAWKTGHDEWSDDYGRETFSHSIGGEVKLNWTKEDLEEILARENPLREEAGREPLTLEEKMGYAEDVRKMANYNSWLVRRGLEGESDMIKARKFLYSGKRKLLEEQDLEGSRKDLLEGMELLDGVINNEENGQMLLGEADIKTDAIKSVIMLEYIARIFGESLPDTFPLKQIWDNPENQSEIQEQRENFKQKIGSDA